LQNLGEAKVRLTLDVSGTRLAHANLRDGDASASIELAVCGAAKRAFVKTLSFTILAVKVSPIALLASLNHAVATVGCGAAGGVELACSSTAKRAAVEALGLASLLIQISAIALFTFIDLAVAAVRPNLGAASGVELADRGAAKSAAVETLGLASLFVQIRAIALFVAVNLAVATVGRSIGASAGVKLTSRGAAERAAVKAFGHAGLLIQICAVTLLTSLDDTVATHCLRIIVTATAAKRHQRTRQQQHWQQPTLKPYLHNFSSFNTGNPLGGLALGTKPQTPTAQNYTIGGNENHFTTTTVKDNEVMR